MPKKGLSVRLEYTFAIQTIRMKRGFGITSKKTGGVRKMTRTTRVVQKMSQNLMELVNVTQPQFPVEVVCILRKGQNVHQMNTSALQNYTTQLPLERRYGIIGIKTEIVKKKVHYLEMTRIIQIVQKKSQKQMELMNVTHVTFLEVVCIPKRWQNVHQINISVTQTISGGTRMMTRDVRKIHELEI